MKRKITTTAVPISAGDIIAGFSAISRGKSYIEKLEDDFAKYIGSKHAFLVSSGNTAFYIILKVLRQLSDRKEVVIPAYTASTVTLSIRKAGLKPILCDISLDTFNMDIKESLARVISDDTLCLVPTHLFGLPCDTLSVNALANEKNVFVIEDTAQGMGASLCGEMTGTIGDFGFFSLAKGKNLSTYTGGIIVSNRSDLAQLVKEEIEELESPGLRTRMLNPFMLSTLALAVRPGVYGMFHWFLSQFKATKVYYSFDAMKYTEFQAAAGISLLKKFPDFVETRQRNGSLLYTSLSKINGIRLPVIIDNGEPVYNYFPVLFESSEHIEQIRQELWDLGIDTTRMYLRPVHHCFDLGYDKTPETFPNATYLAERLLILPTHPFVDKLALKKIIGTFEKWYPKKS